MEGSYSEVTTIMGYNGNPYLEQFSVRIFRTILM